MKIIFVIMSYLLGAVPAGYLMVKITARQDIRRFGSGSTGTTNVWRYQGWKTAVPVLLFDLLKGFLPVSWPVPGWLTGGWPGWRWWRL